jgi:gamma-glutamylcyclotransferase (GGCT)/AIG2-like uncharacterized protein YtfP
MVRHVFVYGTLMPGQNRWSALAEWTEGTASHDHITGQLFDTGNGYPAATIGSAGLIPGFTVPLAAESLSRALDALDEIEGTSIGLYRRVEVMTAEQVRAWADHWPRETSGFDRIDRWPP